MKNKKLSLKQKEQMILARSSRSSQYSHCVQADVVAHQSKKIVCTTEEGQDVVLSNTKTFDLVVGDRVLLGYDLKQEPQLLEHLPRRNVLYRSTKDGVRKELAANIDLACVILACEPKPWAETIAQYLTYFMQLHIPCAFVLNKVDLGTYPWLEERFTYLEKEMGVRVLKTSCLTGTHLEQLKDLIEGKRVVIMGPSGVGKSSLIKALTQLEHIKVGELSTSERGKHTTSVARLYQLNDTTSLIDSPGIRQCAIEQTSLMGLLEGFPDFQQAGCRFKNCDHLHSQGCLLQECLANGTIPKHRYEDYLALVQKFEL